MFMPFPVPFPALGMQRALRHCKSEKTELNVQQYERVHGLPATRNMLFKRGIGIYYPAESLDNAGIKLFTSIQAQLAKGFFR